MTYDKYKLATPPDDGYCLADDPVICELCGEPCEDFRLEPVTASLSIIVCRECFESDPVEYQDILEYFKTKQL